MIAGSIALTILLENTQLSRLIKLPLRVNFPKEGKRTYTYENISPGFAFDEVIPSWNIDRAESGGIRVELRTNNSNWYVLADWSGDKEWYPRQSVDKQKDDIARVATDTLILKQKSDKIDLRLTLTTKENSEAKPKLKLLTLCFANTETTKEDTTWLGLPKKVLFPDVPQRAQGNYPNGKVLCSATSTSMLLWHWSTVLGRPELNKDVPEVEANVWDPVYKGAGNWPFNTAYFGSFKGLKACVSRFTSLRDLEEITSAGIPVAASVSFDMLRGRPLSKGESGHLILVLGFQEDGTPIINDPAFKDGVRKTYPRADFEKAWCYSHRTVYLMAPETIKLPKDRNKVWSFL